MKNARKWSLNLRAKKSVESLIIKVENDEPLKGRCQVCLEVIYASEEDQNLKEPEVTTAKDKLITKHFCISSV